MDGILRGRNRADCCTDASNIYSWDLLKERTRVWKSNCFEANNLQCASLTTKLAFQAMVDRGAMTPNEWRETMNMTPIPGGDQPIRRLDTQVVNLLKDCLNKINTENYAAMTQVMVMLLKGKEVKEDET